MGVKVREKNGRLYLDVIQGGLHHWETLHIKLSSNPTDKKEQLRFAESCRAKRELQLALGEWNFADSISGRKLLIDYIEKIAESKTYPYRHFVLWIKRYKDGGQIQLQSINDRWCYDFQKFLVSQATLSDMTVNQIMGWLRYSLNNAVREGIIPKNPVMQVKPLKLQEVEKDILSADEVSSIYSVITETDFEDEVKRAFLFACQTGLRYSDIRTLQWKHIEKMAVSKYNKHQYWIKKAQVKTKRIVEIPLTDSAYELIKPMGVPDVYIFGSFIKWTICAGDKRGNAIIKKFCQTLGIEKKITWHTARRTFATLELESGADPFTVQRLMGHRNISMTGIYAKSNNIKSSAVQGIENLIKQSENDNIKQLGGN